MTENQCTDKKFICYTITDKALIVETFYTVEERNNFINKNPEFKAIDSLVIGYFNEAA